MCREKDGYKRTKIEHLGSPLRVQGKGLNLVYESECIRITPACAGKRMFAETSAIGEEDHPCVCREKRTKPFTISYEMGSPLRVQGKDF